MGRALALSLLRWRTCKGAPPFTACAALQDRPLNQRLGYHRTKQRFPNRFPNHRSPDKGFTLIEVLVALLIVGIALSAMLVRIHGFIDNTIYLREKTLASWVALNQLELVKLSNQATYQLLEDEISGDTEMANRQWVWTIKPIEIEAEGYQQLQVSVALSESPEDALATITGIIDTHY